MKKPTLVVVSNHPPHGWLEEQKAPWGRIIYEPFPAIKPEWSRGEVERQAMCFWRYLYDLYLKDLKDEDIYFCVQGEYTFTIYLTLILAERYGLHKIVFPTTEREVIEVVSDEGKTIKTSVFKFVQWR